MFSIKSLEKQTENSSMCQVLSESSSGCQEVFTKHWKNFKIRLRSSYKVKVYITAAEVKRVLLTLESPHLLPSNLSWTR